MPRFGGDKAGGEAAMAMLWVLNLADGRHSLLDMAERSGVAFSDLREAARVLREHDLLAPAERAGALERFQEKWNRFSVRKRVETKR